LPGVAIVSFVMATLLVPALSARARDRAPAESTAPVPARSIARRSRSSSARCPVL